MEDTQKTRRLTKRVREHTGPPVAYLNAGNSRNTLKRSPSDSSYSYFSHQSLGGPAAPSSSTTTGPSPQLRRSPSLLTSVYEQPTAHPKYSTSASPFAHHLPPASVGAPFNAAVTEALHAVRAAGPLRPSPPQHAYTDQPKYISPKLRQSASYTAIARRMDTPPSGTKSPRSNRYSDEGNSAGGKKKSTFSSFMSNLVSSPRRPTISTPTNPMHVTHVSIDNETGEFTVRGFLLRNAPAPRTCPANRVFSQDSLANSV
jgi:p21-activated kinase 1